MKRLLEWIFWCNLIRPTLYKWCNKVIINTFKNTALVFSFAHKKKYPTRVWIKYINHNDYYISQSKFKCKDDQNKSSLGHKTFQKFIFWCCFFCFPYCYPSILYISGLSIPYWLLARGWWLFPLPKIVFNLKVDILYNLSNTKEDWIICKNYRTLSKDVDKIKMARDNNKLRFLHFRTQ